MGANNAFAQTLAIRAIASGSDASVLDELVTEVSVDESRLNSVDEDAADDLLLQMEAAATEINNAGLTAQISFLLERGICQADIETSLGLAA
jgi:predicted phosphoribosyltransferase